MKTIEHTPGPWQQSWQFIVAADPDGIHPDIYLAEIAEGDSDGRIASPEQQAANGRLIVAAPDLLAACRMVVARWERGDLAEAARACQSAVELATASGPPWDVTDGQAVAGKPWSVLLLYPDYANDGGTETYYAFVEATDPIEAVTQAQRRAVAAQEGIDIEPDDFAPLLVTARAPLRRAAVQQVTQPPTEKGISPMTQYIVHLYREMRLTFADIEADTPEAAAAFARDKATSEADDLEDCEGENLSALVDLAGDEEYRHSVTIDFEAERTARRHRSCWRRCGCAMSN